MTGKNCENCNAAPAAWFCNSDGTPASNARIFVYFSVATRLFPELENLPLRTRTDR